MDPNAPSATSGGGAAPLSSSPPPPPPFSTATPPASPPPSPSSTTTAAPPPYPHCHAPRSTSRLAVDEVARTLGGTAVYTVCNSSNEFVPVSDPNNGARSLGILCFRQEDTQSLLAQVQLRKPGLGKGDMVVPITLDQIYTLKVEGIAFRVLPDPLQIKNALELKGRI